MVTPSTRRRDCANILFVPLSASDTTWRSEQHFGILHSVKPHPQNLPRALLRPRLPMQAFAAPEKYSPWQRVLRLTPPPQPPPAYFACSSQHVLLHRTRRSHTNIFKSVVPTLKGCFGEHARPFAPAPSFHLLLHAQIGCRGRRSPGSASCLQCGALQSRGLLSPSTTPAIRFTSSRLCMIVYFETTTARRISKMRSDRRDVRSWVVELL